MLKKEKIWGDEEEEKLLNKSIEAAAYEAHLKVKVGENDLAAQKSIALKLVNARNALYELINIKTSPLEHTAESIAEDVRIDRFVSMSTFTEDDGKLYFVNHDEFLNRRSDIDVIKIYNVIIEELSKDNLEILRKLPENEWFMKNGLMDKEGNLDTKELLEFSLKEQEPVIEQKTEEAPKENS